VEEYLLADVRQHRHGFGVVGHHVASCRVGWFSREWIGGWQDMASAGHVCDR